MSIYEINGFDYEEYLNTVEDFKNFGRLQDLSKKLHKPARECLDEIVEFAKLHAKIQKREEPQIYVVKTVEALKKILKDIKENKKG